MKRFFTHFSALLLTSLAALLDADAPPPSPKPWTLGERDGRRCLLTPEGKAFMMFGISQMEGTFAKGVDKTARLDAVEQKLRGWGFNTLPVGDFRGHFPFIAPLDRICGQARPCIIGALSRNSGSSRIPSK